MSRSLNAHSLDRLTNTLQNFENDEEALGRSRQHYDTPPPPYESRDTTEPPSPSFYAINRNPEEERRFNEPLNSEELHFFRTCFDDHTPESRYLVDRDQEEQRIHLAFADRDILGQLTYHGPDLIGDAGKLRELVMARHGIKKRWRALGVWDESWGIPGRLQVQDGDDRGMWKWPWPLETRKRAIQPLPSQQYIWPEPRSERIHERAMRQLLESKGQWVLPAPLTVQSADAEYSDEEVFIMTRPWFKWVIEVQEERIRGRRCRHYWKGGGNPPVDNTRLRWKERGDWKDTWLDVPGWRWRNESPSPEPADPNNMDFSPSEIDALEAIHSPTPSPPPLFPVPISYFADHGRSSMANIFGNQSEETHKETQEAILESEPDGTLEAPADTPATHLDALNQNTEGWQDLSSTSDGVLTTTGNASATTTSGTSSRKRQRSEEIIQDCLANGSVATKNQPNCTKKGTMSDTEVLPQSSKRRKIRASAEDSHSTHSHIEPAPRSCDPNTSKETSKKRVRSSNEEGQELQPVVRRSRRIAGMASRSKSGGTTIFITDLDKEETTDKSRKRRRL